MLRNKKGFQFPETLTIGGPAWDRTKDPLIMSQKNIGKDKNSIQG